MSTLISFHDCRMSVQLGERTHKEYGWIEDVQERILQLSFQLTRSISPEQLTILRTKYQTLIWGLFSSKEIATSRRYEFISLIYRIMLHTRDIISGKGEYMLSYMMLGEWVRYATCSKDCPQSTRMANDLANAAIESFVKVDGLDHPYGSWKDMKYFANYLRDHVVSNVSTLVELPIFKHMIGLIVEQLRKDVVAEEPSLMCKWLPREKSKKFGWLAQHIAVEYHNEWIKTAPYTHQHQAIRKCLVHYRQTISHVNRRLNTVQIDQCAGNWRKIDFAKSVTSITMARQRKAFQYVARDGELRGTVDDRVICGKNFETYVDKCDAGELGMKGGRVGLPDLVKEAMRLGNAKDDKMTTQRKALNSQWRNSSPNTDKLSNFIAMVDTSDSMECDGKKPLYSAIGLGCRVAERSKLGRRIITFSAAPRWVDLSDSHTLTDMVAKVSESKLESWSMNSNFVQALKLILDGCIEKDLAPEVVSDLVLAVFSDMQIDQAGSNVESMSGLINEMFAMGGKQTSHRRPYEAPHILFWNLRSTNGFPGLSTSRNTSMLSGFSATLLDTFCNKGPNSTGICTPWTMLNEQLLNWRYMWAYLEVSQYRDATASSDTSHRTNNNMADLTQTDIKIM